MMPSLHLPPEEQFQENPFLRAAVQDALRKQVEAKEQLIRDHFADTPLALESAIRTGIMPWNVEVQTHRPNLDFDEDATTFRIVERARVVEYPR